MLLNIDNLVEKHNMNICGVIHIGAHYGDEYDKFKNVGAKNFLFFEPNPDSFDKLKNHIEGCDTDGISVIMENVALGHRDEENKTMYVETVNKGMSCSLLKPKKHVELYPNITFDSTIKVKQTFLDKYFDESDLDILNYNMINIDVQGYELEVFKGAMGSLTNIDYVMTEVNLDELYEGCPMLDELDEFLGNIYGFERVEQRIVHDSWGDALYIRKEV